MNRGEHVDTIAHARIGGAGRALLPDDGPVDVHLAGGRIVDIAPSGAMPVRGSVLDAEGGWLVPGMWDHHVHAVAWALSAERVSLGATDTAVHAARAMADAPVQPDGRRIGIGFRDALWPDAPTLDALDAVTGDVPTYLINADVHSVWLNSAALRREHMSVDASGVLREQPAFEISRRLGDVDPLHADAAVARVADAAAARGVVGIVDLDMGWNADMWRRRRTAGFDGLRVSFGLYQEHLERAIADGLRTGDAIDESGLVRAGPLKIILDGSLGTRTAACSHAYGDGPSPTGVLSVDPAGLVDLMTRAAGAGLECAVHAIGDVANTRALDAFAASGAQGTIEHAQLVAHADLIRFGRLGVSASVQPVQALDDRELAEAVWAGQTASAYPLRSLHAAGAGLRFGSDAPVTPLDPWAAIAAAVFRRRDRDEPWHPEETLDARTALAAATRSGTSDPAEIAPGAVADLVLVGEDPLQCDEAALRKMAVHVTLLAGRVTHAT